jgi:hypothetical protein
VYDLDAGPMIFSVLEHTTITNQPGTSQPYGGKFSSGLYLGPLASCVDLWDITAVCRLLLLLCLVRHGAGKDGKSGEIEMGEDERERERERERAQSHRIRVK